MLTVRGLGLTTGAVVAWGVGRLLGISELYVVAVACAAVVAIGAILVRVGTSTLAVRRRVGATHLLHGASTSSVLEVASSSWLPSPALYVEDARPAPLRADSTTTPVRWATPRPRPGRVATLRDEVVGRRRGRHPVGPATISVRDPFGAVERARRFRGTDEVVVYPIIEALGTTGPIGLLAGTGTSTNRQVLAAGDEFHTMREYVRGDDLRRVHWATTARRGALMVRQDDQPWEARATVVCDTRIAEHGGMGPASTVERAISVAASIVWHLADRGYAISLITETDRGTATPRHWGQHLDRLAELEPTRGRSLAPALDGIRGDAAGGLLIAVVAPPAALGARVGADPEARALRRAGQGFATRIAVVCAPAGAATARAESLSGALATGGWRSTVLGPEDPLGPRWSDLTRRRSRSAPAPAGPS